MNGKININISDMFQMKVGLTKCPSKTERGICQDFPPTMIDDFCKKLPKKDEMWSDFVADLKHFDPHCTVPKVSI
jgi:hypothetical protein